MFNEKARKVMMEYMDKIGGIEKKYGCKRLGSWGVPNEHLSFEVFEGSFEAFQKAGMEPVILALSAYETYEVKVATSTEEATKMLKQAK
jgi:hypothetical protein